MKKQEVLVYIELARRYVQFHQGKTVNEIGKIFGLFYWGEVNQMVKDNKIINSTDWTKENKSGWVTISQTNFDLYVLPIVKEIKNGTLYIADFEIKEKNGWDVCYYIKSQLYKVR